MTTSFARPEARSGSSEPRRTVHLGRYELLLRIGRGGLGQVFLARAAGAAGFERFFAIKMLHGDLGWDPSVSNVLLREARLASRIDHRNVVGILDVGVHGEEYYLVMEYVEGPTLADLCQQNHHFRPEGLLGAILLDALDGLHAAHDLTDEFGAPMNLVHLDFSPQNLLIGKDGTCRVTDFGIARTGSLLPSTKPGVIRGKPSFMAPEQIVGEQVDRRTDVFCAGIVLWNALTGKRLFDGPSEAATMYNVLRRRIPRPSTVGQKPDASLDATILKSLQRRPEARFQSAAEMASALRTVLLRRGLLGSPREVAEWVELSFGEQLASRRKAMRRIADEHRVSPQEDGRPLDQHTLPDLNPLEGRTSLDDSELMLTPLELRTGAISDLDTREVDGESYSKFSLEASGEAYLDSLRSDSPSSRRWKRRMVGGLLFVLLAGFLLWLGTQLPQPTRRAKTLPKPMARPGAERSEGVPSERASEGEKRPQEPPTAKVPSTARVPDSDGPPQPQRGPAPAVVEPKPSKRPRPRRARATQVSSKRKTPRRARHQPDIRPQRATPTEEGPSKTSEASEQRRSSADVKSEPAPQEVDSVLEVVGNPYR